MSPMSQTSAGAISRSSAIRVRGAPRSAETGAIVRAKADGALRVEAEGNGFVDLEIGETSRLRQCNADAGARPRFANQHCRVGAVEQQAFNVSREVLRTGWQLGRIPRERDDFRAHERLDPITDGDGTACPRADRKPIDRGKLHQTAIDARRFSDNAIVRADKARDERRSRLVVELLD